MKKGLLLSVVASGFIFAGGNIAPVAPVAPAAAPAACDFWGSIGSRYEFKDNGTLKFGDKENNSWKTTINLGVEKQVGYGFGFGAEVAATTQLGLDIAGKKAEDAELSQLYITYKNGNTAVKVGRQALPSEVSPWAWTDSTLGRKDTTFEGVVVVNTDLADTTLAAAWIPKYGDGATFKKVNGVNNKGLFELAAINKSIANTTLSGSAYYVTAVKGKSVWAAAETKAGNVDLGLQLAYAKMNGLKGTFGVAAYAGTSFNAFSTKLTLAYLNDGTTSLNLGGTSGFWGDSVGSAFGGDVSAAGKQKIAALSLGYAIPNAGKVYFDLGADKPTTGKTAFATRLGYKFKVAGIKSKIEYRYIKNKKFTSSKNQRVRIEGVYKF